jgi:hypothetical protein
VVASGSTGRFSALRAWPGSTDAIGNIRGGSWPQWRTRPYRQMPRRTDSAFVRHQDIDPTGIVNLSRGGILLPSVARRFGAEKSLSRLQGCPRARERGQEGRLDRVKLTTPAKGLRPLVAPLSPGSDHINLTASALRADQPPAPIDDRGFRAVALRLLSDMRLDLTAVFGRKWDQNCEAARLTKDQSVLWQCPSWGHPVDLEKVWWRLAETRCLPSGRR